jgi:ATP-dependent Clp protease ATP-binding subunit ClpB
MIRKHPYSVVLFDEIEKAHHDVLNILLQVLDDGRLTDGQGRTVNFRNSVLIMTSNLGSHIISNATNGSNDPKVQKEVLELLRSHFKPEFLNRIDDIIIFNQLEARQLHHVVRIQMKGLIDRLAEKKIGLEFSDEALNYIAQYNSDMTFGARPIKRAIQTLVEDPLANQLISGELTEGEIIKVELVKGQLQFSSKKSKAA